MDNNINNINHLFFKSPPSPPHTNSEADRQTTSTNLSANGVTSARARGDLYRG